MFVQVFDPEAFGGLTSFIRQTDWIAKACVNTPPIDPRGGPSAGHPRRGTEGRQGPRLGLHEEVMESLVPWMEKLAVEMPAPQPPR